MKFPELFRVTSAFAPYTSAADDPYGVFVIPGHCANGRDLKVIACDGLTTGWDHVSVTVWNAPHKPPSWEEMCLIKNLFWDEAECVVQFHPPSKDYVNFTTGCLHLWKQVSAPFPMPPKICV